MEKKLAVLIPYFGRIPDYFSFFIQTCEANPFIDFLIFTDDSAVIRGEYGENIRMISMKVPAFSQLVSEKLDTSFTLHRGYKLCDLRPMFGRIFEDYISDYAFWGFCDVDILFGDLSRIITPEVLENYDIISFYPQFISGPFCILRNQKEVNELSMKSRDYEKVLLDPQHFAFDEIGGIDAIRQVWKGVSIPRIESPIESFTHVVCNPEKCALRILFADYIIDREIIRGEEFAWKEGRLFLKNDEIFIYHYMWNKDKVHLNVPAFHRGRDFVFSRNGFFYFSLKSHTIDWLFSIISNSTIKAMRKIQYLTRG